METTIEMKYTDVAAKMSDIIKRDKTKITKNDPALIFNWDLLALQGFAERANRFVTGVAGAPVLPPWLTKMPPMITQTSLTRDIFTYLAQLVGGRFHAVMLAPNTQEQFAHLIVRLRDVETHPFMQAGMAKAPDGQMLAVTGMLVDGRRALNPQPLNLVPPAGYRQVFIMDPEGPSPNATGRALVTLAASTDLLPLPPTSLPPPARQTGGLPPPPVKHYDDLDSDFDSD